MSKWSKSNRRIVANEMVINDKLLDELMKGYKNLEGLLGENELLTSSL